MAARSSCFFVLVTAAVSAHCGRVATVPADATLADSTPPPTDITVLAPTASSVIVRDAANALIAITRIDATRATTFPASPAMNITVIVPAAASGHVHDVVMNYLAAEAGDTLYAYPREPAEPSVEYQVKLPPSLPESAQVQFRATCANDRVVFTTLAAATIKLHEQCRSFSVGGYVVDPTVRFAFYRADIAIDPSVALVDLTDIELQPLEPYVVGYTNPNGGLRTGYIGASIFNGRLGIGPRAELTINENAARTVMLDYMLAPVNEHGLQVELGLVRGTQVQKISRFGTPDDVRMTDIAQYELPWLSAAASFDVATGTLTWAPSAGNPPDAIRHALQVRKPNAPRPSFEIQVVAPINNAATTVTLPPLPAEFAQYTPATDDQITITSMLLSSAPDHYRGIVGYALSALDYHHKFRGAYGTYVYSLMTSQ